MTTWPAPSVPSIPAGYGPQQSDLTTWWQDNAAFLQNRVVARVRQATTATTLPTGGVGTTIAFDTVDEDPYGGWNASAHTWTPPAGYSGWYQVCLTLRTVALASGDAIRALLGGFYNYHLSTAVGPVGHGAGAEGQFVVYLVGGQDTVTGQGALLNASASISTSIIAGQQSTMDIVWLGLS